MLTACSDARVGRGDSLPPAYHIDTIFNLPVFAMVAYCKHTGPFQSSRSPQYVNLGPPSVDIPHGPCTLQIS